MTVLELNERLNRRFPPALSSEWDNDGLQVWSDPNAKVTGVLIALDPTDAAIDEAEKTGCSVILTHHPLIFQPLSDVTPESGVGRRVQRLLSLGISAISCHTRCDAAEGGINDSLADMLGLTDVTPFADGIPRIGTLTRPMPPAEAVSFVLGATGAPKALYSGKAPERITRIAVCGGSGKDCLFAAAEAGADLYFTGELSYHSRLDAYDLPLLTMEVGHDISERHAVTVFYRALSSFAPELPTVLFDYRAGNGFSGGRLDI